MEPTERRLGVLAGVMAVCAAVASPIFAEDSWTLWRGTTTFTDVNARLPAEVQVEVQTGLDRASCESLKENKLAEARPPSQRGPGASGEDGFLRLERAGDRTTKMLMRYLCVRADARPGPAPWYSPGRTDP